MRNLNIPSKGPSRENTFAMPEPPKYNVLLASNSIGDGRWHA
eukprot:COSAG05_NODE_7474_length_806_cov_1.315417_1_plen_41_part_01